MELLNNPFHILGATLRDDRQRIVELAEEKSLITDSALASEARTVLTNPRKRLSAEISWLPGVAPAKIPQLLTILKDEPEKVLSISNLPKVTVANLLAEGISNLKVPAEPEKMSEWIFKLAQTFEEIEVEAVQVLLNEERAISNFPKISDSSLVVSECEELRRHFATVMKAALNRLPSKKLVKAVTLAVASGTRDGEVHGPILLDDLVDIYEVEVQGFLNKEQEAIEFLIDKVNQAATAEKPREVIQAIIDKLELAVKNWDEIAQPIQVSTKSRGIDHGASRHVAGLVRDLAISLFNEHGELDLSQRLTSLLQEVFAEVRIVAERTAEDISTLDDLAAQRKKYLEEAIENAEKWRTEITYETELGLLFKKKLKISPDGVEWDGIVQTLDSVNRVRWGGTKHSVNGIPTGTSYTISFGGKYVFSTVETRQEHVYTRFIECLWKAIGSRILTDFLQGLSEGKTYTFGSANVSDFGIQLLRRKFIGADVPVFCKWNELSISNGPGTFNIIKTDDRKISESLSYLNQDNVHILETAMRVLWKNYSEKLSSLLER